MRFAFTSRRPFNDGPLEQPLPENDQVNMAYMLDANYFSFFTLKKLSPPKLEARLLPFDAILIPLDVRDFETVKLIVEACNDRYIIYSEGGISDYQMLTPTNQNLYLQIISHAKAIFLYWEKFVPFFQSVTTKPVYYLPYPFFVDFTKPYYVPIEERANRISLPSGLAGGSRNGLSSLLVTRQILSEALYTEVDCWLAPATFTQDAESVYNILTGKTLQTPKASSSSKLRRWLIKSEIDYRPILNLKKTVRANFPKTTTTAPKTPTIKQDNITFLRRNNWLAYLQRLGKNRLVIDLNNRPTVGRNALDCAALSIPCISTAYSDIQAKLFPQTTLDDSWDIPKAVELSRKLLDTGFYSEVTQEATRQLAEFLPDAFTTRFNNIFDNSSGIWKPRA